MEKTREQKQNTQKGRLSLWISLAVVIILIPAVFFAAYALGDRRFTVPAVIMAVLAMVPFFVSFEGKKPDAAVLAVLAVMTAIAIVSRAAFVWLPNFKPMAGIIIITAVAFGPQAGFMCGSLSMLASNIFFGQGPWTPVQMFCYGMIGFIAGFLAKGHVISHRHAIRSGTVTFILVFVLSAAVLDSYSVLYILTNIGTTSAAAVYIAGIPANAANALASGICVFILIKPMNAMLSRIKTKYGLK